MKLTTSDNIFANFSQNFRRATFIETPTSSFVRFKFFLQHFWHTKLLYTYICNFVIFQEILQKLYYTAFERQFFVSSKCLGNTSQEQEISFLVRSFILHLCRETLSMSVLVFRYQSMENRCLYCNYFSLSAEKLSIQCHTICYPLK